MFNVIIAFCVVSFLFDLYYTNKWRFCRYKFRKYRSSCRNWMCEHSHDCYYCKYNYCLKYSLDDTKFIFFLPEMEREYKKRQKKGMKGSI